MKKILAALVVVIGFSPLCYGIDAATLSELEGYTIVASTNATGELEGADIGKLVKLNNGMIFEFQSYDYFYEYQPEVIVFAKALTLPTGKAIIDYKLVISDEDEVLDFIRIR